ncbi:MAG: conjugal transfer protein, partial [Novosphingobium sp.]|nr:conjugal transfer protein [Novosphingobium sp.]
EVYTKVRMPQPAAPNPDQAANDVMGAMRSAMATPQGMANVPNGNPLHAPGN